MQALTTTVYNGTLASSVQSILWADKMLKDGVRSNAMNYTSKLWTSSSLRVEGLRVEDVRGLVIDSDNGSLDLSGNGRVAYAMTGILY